MKSVGRITRTVQLVGFALLSAGCADHEPTSPNVAPTLGSGAVGSIIKSSVVTATTLCRPSGECSTSTRYSEISEKVGSPSTLRAGMGMSVGGAQSNRPASAQKNLSAKKLHVSGRTLYGDAVSEDGSASHIELTGDAGAKGKLSAVRVFRDGKPLLAINAKWKDIGGVSYREHSDVTVYSEGRVAMREEKEFTPIAVLPGGVSDRSPASLTLSSTQVIYGDEGVDCPFSYDVCLWLQSYTPEAAVNRLWTTMADVGYDISNWWNQIWAGADGDTGAQLAETVMFAMEAYGDPGIAAFAITVASIASGGLTNALVNDVADEIIEWLFWFFFIGV